MNNETIQRISANRRYAENVLADENTRWADAQIAEEILWLIDAISAEHATVKAEALREAAKKIEPKTKSTPTDPGARAMKCDAIALRHMADNLEGK